MLSLYIIQHRFDYYFEAVDYDYKYLVVAKNEVSAREECELQSTDDLPHSRWRDSSITKCDRISSYDGLILHTPVLMCSRHNG